MSPDAPQGPQDASEPEVVPVWRRPGEAVCARCGRVWEPSSEAPTWSIGTVSGQPGLFCTPCVREIEREVEIALQTEPWDTR